MVGSKNNPAERSNKSASSKSKFEKLSTDPSFVVKEIEVTGADYLTPTIICRDNRGFYMTTPAYVGSSRMDPYRNESYKRNGLDLDTLELHKVDPEIIALTDDEWIAKIK